MRGGSEGSAGVFGVRIVAGEKNATNAKDKKNAKGFLSRRSVGSDQSKGKARYQLRYEDRNRKVKKCKAAIAFSWRVRLVGLLLVYGYWFVPVLTNAYILAVFWQRFGVRVCTGTSTRVLSHPVSC
jgi:hypothetical protein